MELRFQDNALPQGITFEVVDGKVVSFMLDTDEPDVHSFLKLVQRYVEQEKQAKLLK